MPVVSVPVEVQQAAVKHEPARRGGRSAATSASRPSRFGGEHEREVKVVGLNLELATIVAALEAGHLLVLGDVEATAEWRPKQSVAAILALVTSRLELIRGVIRGEVDPAIIWTEHCATVAEDEALDSDDGEVRLAVWTVQERIEKVRAELERLSRRRRHGEV